MKKPHSHYETTANRLRPQCFEELAGQDFVVHTLIGSLQSNRVAHAYLFSGPRGVGKTSAARLLALAVNRPEGNPIANLQYDGSDDIRHGRAPDVIEIDGASYTGVENIRNIREEILYRPVQLPYKVYIIDEVHMLSNSAFNALLKTIEEPPEYVVFIFATTELHKVPATIRSRCQQFAFKRIGIQYIERKLTALCEKTNVDAEQDALTWIAKESDGSLRDAYMLFDQALSFCALEDDSSQNKSGGKSSSATKKKKQRITLADIKKHLGLMGTDALNQLFTHCVDQQKKEALEIAHSLYSSGVSSEQVIFEACEYARNILFIKAGITSTALLGYPVSHFEPRVYQTLSHHSVERALELLLECYRNLRYTVNQRFEVELTIASLCALTNYVTPAQLVDRLETLQTDTSQLQPNQLSFRSNRAPDAQQNTAPITSPLNYSAPQRASEHTRQPSSTNADLDTHETAADPRWNTVLERLQEYDDRLHLIVETARADVKKNTITLVFTKQYALSAFEKQRAIVEKIAGDIFQTTVTLNGIFEKSEQRAKQSPAETALLTPEINPTIKKERHSPQIQNVLEIFGGSVQHDEQT